MGLRVALKLRQLFLAKRAGSSSSVWAYAVVASRFSATHSFCVLAVWKGAERQKVQGHFLVMAVGVFGQQ